MEAKAAFRVAVANGLNTFPCRNDDPAWIAPSKARLSATCKAGQHA